MKLRQYLLYPTERGTLFFKSRNDNKTEEFETLGKALWFLRKNKISKKLVEILLAGNKNQ